MLFVFERLVNYNFLKQLIIQYAMARPLEHKREEVITAAMQIFWDKGYAATSLADLKAATGLNPGSLYSSYTSKEALFIATLEFYCSQSIENLQTTLSQGTDSIANIYQFFANFEARQSEPSKGCFFVNTLIEMAPHNAKVKALLGQYTERYQHAFHDALQRAQEHDLLARDCDIQTTSNQLMLTIWGLRVMHRSDLDIDTATIVKQQLDDIFSKY